MKEIIFLNGKFLSKEKARLSVFTPGFLSGWGLFETMRSFQGKIVYLEKHLKRLERSCKLVAIKTPFSVPGIKGIIKKALRISGFKDAYIRLTLTKSIKGADILMVVKKYQPYPEPKYKTGFKVGLSSFRQDAGSTLAKIKSTSRLLYQLSLGEARRRGFDEALILNNRGYLAEGAISNLFLVKGRSLFTPALECGCLEGITRRVVLDLARKYRITASEGKFTLNDLYGADEAFLTNSLIGVMPLVSVEKRLIAQGARGEITGYLIKKYHSLLKNGN